MGQRVGRLVATAAAVAAVTYFGSAIARVNATTAGFAYLLLVLTLASTWGFVEAGAASVLATLTFNFFFLPPMGTFTIADPQNWVALLSFLATALIASRLSEHAKRRAMDAWQRQRDVERLYTFSRAMLLIGGEEPFARQLTRRLADVFELHAVALYDRRAEETYRGGPGEFEGLDGELRDAALQGAAYTDPRRGRVITAIRLGAEPIASLGIEGPPMPDAVLQGIANLAAIGLERARAQDLAHQVEAARQSEELRTTLIDAMAHELKTPLTSIRAATTSLLDNPEQPLEARRELVKVADEEAARLKVLIDNAVEMARLDAASIEVDRERADLGEVVREVVVSMQREIDGRPVEVTLEESLPQVRLDRRLIKVAIQQLLDNALKYSPPGAPVTIQARRDGETVLLDLSDRGRGIPVQEQAAIFERFYRSPTVKSRIPGSGLGLSIAHRIAQAHNGELTVTSNPGATTFRLRLPIDQEQGAGEDSVARGTHSRR